MNIVSEKEHLRRRIASSALREAWKLLSRAKGYEWATVLRLAWQVVRSRTRLHYTKAAGVSASGTPRQARLHWLLQYEPDQVVLMLTREPENRFDSRAVKVIGSVGDGAGFTLGYLKANIAAQVAPLLDAGHTAVAMMEKVTGVGSKGLYGMNFRFGII